MSICAKAKKNTPIIIHNTWLIDIIFFCIMSIFSCAVHYKKRYQLINPSVTLNKLDDDFV